MAKRGTTKPIKILVHPALMETDQIVSLIEQGHEIKEMPKTTAGYDLIIGPNCWRITLGLVRWTVEAVKAMQNVKVRRVRKT
jgi:hypothetical protein